MKILLVLSALIAAVYSEAGYNYRPPAVIDARAKGQFNGYNYQQPIVQNLKSFHSGRVSTSNDGYHYPAPVVQDLRTNVGHLSQSVSSSFSSQAPLVHKHVYVHVAPEEPEELRQNAIQANYRPQKHYKIIFVKTPSPPEYIPPSIQAQAQNQEKTIIYVLVKKPEDVADIHVPSSAPIPPSKPEVYFIKYKTQKEHGAVHADSIGHPGVSFGSGSVGGQSINLNTASVSSSSGSFDSVHTSVTPSSAYGVPL